MDPGNPYYFEPPAPPRRGLNPGVVAFAVVLLGALGVYLVVLLADGGDDDEDANPPGPPTPFEAGSSELPDVLVGHWTGTVSQKSSGTTYDVDMTLSGGTEDVGDVEYPDLDCSGNYTLEEVGADTVTLTEHITDGVENCLDGVEVTLRYVDDDHIFYSFENEGDPQDGTADLSRGE